MRLDTATAAWVDDTARRFAEHARFDGDTWDMDDGRVMTLHVEPDPDMSIMDEQGEGVWCGQLEWTHQTNDYGWPARPEWADGGAEILQRDRGDVLWWRPLDDCLQDRGLRDRVRSTVCELLKYGYVSVGVEVEGETAWLGGCDSVYPELVEELAGEALYAVTVRKREGMAYRMGGALLGVG